MRTRRIIRVATNVVVAIAMSAGPVLPLTQAAFAVGTEAPTLTSPSDGAVVGADAALSWQPVTGATAYRLQLSGEADFDFAHETIDTVATSVEPDLYFTPGTWYWRVATLDGDLPGAWATASFQVVRTDIPLPTAPPSGTTYTYPGPGPVVSFTPSLAGPYEIQLDGPWGVGSYVSYATRFALPQALPVGTWTWRVRPYVHNAGMPWSPARTFVVSWPESDPVIDGPADGAAVESFVMDWQAIPGAASYDVQVSPVNTFPQSSRTDVTTHVTMLDLGRGGGDETRYWRVRGRNGPVISPWSATRSVTHASWSAAPTDLWPPNGTFTVPPTLRWSPVVDASRYDIQIAQDPSDLEGSALACRTFVNAASFAKNSGGDCALLDSLLPGPVYWRVRGLDDPSRATSDWSEIGQFQYDPPNGGPALAAPVVATPLGPADCTDVTTCERETEMPLLSWQPIDHAKFYRVQLDVRDAHLPGSTFDTPGMSFVPPRDALAGLGDTRFSWQVIACESEATCPTWTDASAALRHFAIAPRPLVLSPANGTDGTGEIELGFAMEAIDAPTPGDPWEIAQMPAHLWVQVDDEPDFELPHLFDAGLDRPQLTLGALPAGQLHWRVSYGDPTASTGTVSRNFDWTFQTDVTEPPDGQVLDAPARVGWTPTQGAASYVVEVNREGWQPPLLNGEQQWTNALIGDDFVPGPLAWRVTPVDALGRRGAAVGGAFAVAPKNPVLVSPLDNASASSIGAVFDWEAVDSTVGYRLHVSTSPDFSTLVDSVWTQRTRYIPTIPYPTGQLWWRIRAESGYGQTLGEVIGTSAARRLLSVAPVVADTTAPTGSVSIAGGAAFTKTRDVTVAVPATDVGSGVSYVKLSNDGINWTSRPYASNQAWTLPATNGTRTVYVKWVDKAGNRSVVKTDTIKLDTVAPVVTEPRRGFVVDTAISSGKISLRVPWSGSDATSGIARYELGQSTDGGAWTTVSTTLTSPTATRSLEALHTYRFRVRAVDKAGNTGAWATGPTFRISRYSEFNSAIVYSGTWTTVSSSAYWGGAAKKSSMAGAKASLTFTGRSIAWVARTGPDRGEAQIYVNGSLLTNVDLYSPTAGAQRVVWVGTWTTTSERKVTIRVAGTTGRPRIDLDALVTAN